METPADPRASITYLLQKAASISLGGLEAVLADLDLAARQYVVLASAAAGEQLSQQELAKGLGMDPTMLVKAIDDLEVRGLVERRRFAADRRQHRLEITAAGRALLDAAAERHRRVEANLVEATDAAALRAVLGRLVERARPS